MCLKVLPVLYNDVVHAPLGLYFRHDLYYTHSVYYPCPIYSISTWALQGQCGDSGSQKLFQLNLGSLGLLSAFAHAYPI